MARDSIGIEGLGGRAAGRLAGRTALLQPRVDGQTYRARAPAHRRTPSANPGTCIVTRGSGPCLDRGSTPQLTQLAEPAISHGVGGRAMLSGDRLTRRRFDWLTDLLSSLAANNPIRHQIAPYSAKFGSTKVLLWTPLPSTIRLQAAWPDPVRPDRCLKLPCQCDNRSAIETF